MHHECAILLVSVIEGVAQGHDIGERDCRCGCTSSASARAGDYALRSSRAVPGCVISRLFATKTLTEQASNFGRKIQAGVAQELIAEQHERLGAVCAQDDLAERHVSS